MNRRHHNLPARRVTALLATAGLVLGVAACGGGDDGSADATVPATADLVVTAVPSIRWDKAAYTAPAGEIEVALVNNDAVRHDLVILDGDTKVGNLELVARSRGDVASDTITLEPGTYRIYCIVPGHSQMDSELTVE
jgi:plastocyanin